MENKKVGKMGIKMGSKLKKSDLIVLTLLLLDPGSVNNRSNDNSRHNTHETDHTNQSNETRNNGPDNSCI